MPQPTLRATVAYRGGTFSYLSMYIDVFSRVLSMRLFSKSILKIFVCPQYLLHAASSSTLYTASSQHILKSTYSLHDTKFLAMDGSEENH